MVRLFLGELPNGMPKNRKGCDIGYALAASSCEGANSVETCTVTALDVITAFAVPNPNASSQSQSVFSGLVADQVALASRSPSLLRTGEVLFKPTLSAVDEANLNSRFMDVNAILISISYFCGCRVEKQDPSRKSQEE